VTEARTDGVSAGAGLRYSDGIAGARTLIALEGNATALQHRFPNCLELAPYAGDDLRGKSFRGANVNAVGEIDLEIKGELTDAFDGSERIVGVVIQRPYVDQVYVP
jgi:hypothetical protein